MCSAVKTEKNGDRRSAGAFFIGIQERECGPPLFTTVVHATLTSKMVRQYFSPISHIYKTLLSVQEVVERLVWAALSCAWFQFPSDTAHGSDRELGLLHQEMFHFLFRTYSCILGPINKQSR